MERCTLAKNISPIKRKLPILALLLVGLVGCTYNTLPDDVAVPVVGGEQGFDLNLSTRAEVFDGKQLDSEYFVAEQDLESYLTYKQQHSGKKITVKNCTPYGFDNGHTLFYVLNYADGWEVVSADKRTQATLAYGDGSRTFSMGADNTNEAEKFWMELLASDVLQKRQREGAKDGARLTGEEIADDEEQSNVDFWNRVCATNNDTRAIEVGSTSELPWTPTNHIYFLGSTIDTMAVDKGPYIQTQWDQGHPWNKFCPMTTNDSGRALAGCTIVAGGQLLYYLHQKTGNFMLTPTNVNIEGNIDDYQYTFSNYTNAAWGAMALTDDEHDEDWEDGPTQLVAALLSWIGSHCNTSYTNNGTGAHPYFLFNWMESEFGINSDVEYGHSSSIIKHELNVNQRPIFISGWGDGENGHSWLADGFRTIARVDTVYYIVSDEEMTTEELSQCTFDDATHFIKYELDVDYYAHMNWGWGGSNDGYYSLLSDGWDPLGIPFSIAVSMYYNIEFDV